MKPIPIQPQQLKPFNQTIKIESPHLIIFRKIITDLGKLRTFEKILGDLMKEDELFLYSHVVQLQLGEQEVLAYQLEVVEKQFCYGLTFVWIPGCPLYERTPNAFNEINENELITYIKKQLNVIPKGIKIALNKLVNREITVATFEAICKNENYDEYVNMKEYEEAKNDETIAAVVEEVRTGKLSKANAIKKLDRRKLLTNDIKEKIEAIEVKKQIPKELIDMALNLVEQVEIEIGVKKPGKGKNKEEVTETDFEQRCKRIGVQIIEIEEYQPVIFHTEFKKNIKRYMNRILSKFDMEEFLNKHKKIVDKYPYYKREFEKTIPKTIVQGPLTVLEKTDFAKDKGFEHNETIKTINKATIEKRLTINEGIDFIRRERIHSIHSARIAMKLYADGFITNSQLEYNLKENGCLTETYIAELFELEFDVRRIETYVNTWRLDGLVDRDTYENYFKKCEEYNTKK